MAELDSARRHVRRLEKDLASVKRQLDDAQRQCVVKTAEATSLRAQTMRLAVDCGKLQLRLRGITPATSAATSGASSPQLPGSPVVRPCPPDRVVVCRRHRRCLGGHASPHFSTHGRSNESSCHLTRRCGGGNSYWCSLCRVRGLPLDGVLSVRLDHVGRSPPALASAR
jgi:hypothetical protein